jgi:hypothetical protein
MMAIENVRLDERGCFSDQRRKIMAEKPNEPKNMYLYEKVASIHGLPRETV